MHAWVATCSGRLLTQNSEALAVPGVYAASGAAVLPLLVAVMCDRSNCECAVAAVLL